MFVYVLIPFFSLHVFNQVEAGAIPNVPNAEAELEDYYWRDYGGDIPKDAFPGGINANGRTTYIGQVLHKDQLIPAKIDPEQQKVYYEWRYKEFEATKNIKILCTNHPEQLEWVKTGNTLINNITDKHFVEGGYEAGVTILIGRKLLEDELSVGKIVFTDTQSTLNTTKDGKGHQHAEFYVLCYSPNVKATKKKSDEDDIDVR